MSPSRPLLVSGQVFFKNPEVDRYQVPLGDLGDLRMCDIPCKSHVEITGVSLLDGISSFELYALHSGDYKDEGTLEVYGGFDLAIPDGDADCHIRRVERSLPNITPQSMMRNPFVELRETDSGTVIGVYMNFKYTASPETPVCEALTPFLGAMSRCRRPLVTVFLCHASEDKPSVRNIASALKRIGAEVWLDEWEIKVGESIVEKINEGLGAATHLLVVLSNASVSKPWVSRELSSTLMRQLNNAGITILPLRLDGCMLPPLLADIKYADATRGLEYAIREIESAIFPPNETIDA